MSSDEIRHLVFFHRNNHANLWGNPVSRRERLRATEPSYTCVIDMLEIEYIMSFSNVVISSLKKGEKIPFTFGMSLCHPLDSFCYKTGREMAMKRICRAEASIIEYSFVNNCADSWQETAIFEFHGDYSGLQMTVSRNSKKTRYRLYFKTSAEIA